MYEAALRRRNAMRADLIEDLITGSVETDKGLRAAVARVKQLRKT